MRSLLTFAAALLGAAGAAGACTSDLECSLNGVCSGGKCVCDRPWKGESCGVLGYKTTPVAAKSLFPLDDTRNTWNGPIVGAPDGTYHIFVPVYPPHKLVFPTVVKHGIADKIEGPYNWDQMPDIQINNSNPAFVVYNDSSGKTKYSLWPNGGRVQVADSPYGPFTEVEGADDCRGGPCGNPAPLWHKGAFYSTSQPTKQVFTTPDLASPWTVHGNITLHVPVGKGSDVGKLEDPFMFIDRRDNWHIINHAYDVRQSEHCANSTVSAHSFSPDGKSWHMLTPKVEPYGHTVQYDDGSSHSYTTLERPNIHFDAHGQMTHINFAADMITGDAGCTNITRCPIKSEQGNCACVNCKYRDHAGTVLVALDV